MTINMKNEKDHITVLKNDHVGNMRRLENTLLNMEDEMEFAKNKLEDVQNKIEIAKEEVKKPFPKEQELVNKLNRLNELNALLDMDDNISKDAKIQNGCEDKKAKKVKRLSR